MPSGVELIGEAAGMDQAAYDIALWIVGLLGGAFLLIFGAMAKTVMAKMAKLSDNQSALWESHHSHRTEVAKDYAPKRDLDRVIDTMTQHVDSGFVKLTAELKELERKIDRKADKRHEAYPSNNGGSR